jgi:hypothetical protein
VLAAAGKGHEKHLKSHARRLRRGQELVSAMLWHKLHAETSTPNQDTSINAELTRLEDNMTITALQDLLDTAIRPVQILAEKYNIALHVKANGGLHFQCGCIAGIDKKCRFCQCQAFLDPILLIRHSRLGYKSRDIGWGCRRVFYHVRVHWHHP